MNSLGFDKSPADTRVVVAMSGGVDSAVAAALLKRDGYDVVGITLQLYDHGAAVGRRGSCCAGRDVQDARAVAETLGLPHYVLDYESRFRQAVIDDFVATYRAGATPIPCVRCNQRIKFRDLADMARDLGADALATGHYVRRAIGALGPELRRAVDRRRDQSYFLFATTRAQLDFLRFPIGELAKDDVRRMAADFDLPVAAKPDSQDICFVPNGDYARTIERLSPGAAAAGDIVDLGGRVLGRHQGIIHYTIGQRRGLVGGEPTPLYVIDIDATRRRVVVGPKQALACAHLELSEFNWLGESERPRQPFAVTIKLRSTQDAVPARVTPDSAGSAQVELLDPVFGVSPGQAGAIYDGERLLGGGWIAATDLAAKAMTNVAIA